MPPPFSPASPSARCGGSDELVFINTASFAITGRVSEGLGARPSSIVVPVPGRYALVYNVDGGTVSVVDLEARAVVQTIDVGVQPLVLRLGPDPHRPDGQATYLQAYEEDPDRVRRWAEYQAAARASAQALAAGGAADDPRWIHTDAYDQAYDIRMRTYARLFDRDLGPE